MVIKFIFVAQILDTGVDGASRSKSTRRMPRLISNRQHLSLADVAEHVTHIDLVRNDVTRSIYLFTSDSERWVGREEWV